MIETIKDEIKDELENNDDLLGHIEKIIDWLNSKQILGFNITLNRPKDRRYDYLIRFEKTLKP